jgi:hypothetical protein
LKLNTDELKRQLEDVYESQYFPIYCIGGSVLLVGITNDVLWLLIGLAGFLWGVFRKR